MPDVWIGLIGIVVGTALSLATSVIVNRWQLSKQARVDVWENILPELTLEWTQYKLRSDRKAKENPAARVERPQLSEQLAGLQRKGVLASRVDARAAGRLHMLWAQSTVLHHEARDPTLRSEGPRQPDVIAKELRTIEEEFHQALWGYYNYLEKRLRWS